MSGIDPTEIFRQEAQDLLEVLEQTLLDLERDPGDGDLIATAFRALHTIKGSGAMFGFDAVAAFTHLVENAFDLVRKGDMTPSRELIAIALTARDHMRLLIADPSAARQETGDAILADLQLLMRSSPSQASAGVDPNTLPEGAALNNAPAGVSVNNAPGAGPKETRADEAAPVAAQPGSAGWRIRFRLPRDAMATGTDPLLLLDELRELGPTTLRVIPDDVPSLEDIDPASCYLRWDVTLLSGQSREVIEQVFIFVLDDMELTLEPLAVTAMQPAAATAVRAAPVPESAGTSVEHKNPPAGQAAKQGDTLRVPAGRLDELMDRVGQLVIAQSRLRQIAAASDDVAVKSVAEEIERLALELRDTTMGVRMLPIGQLFGRFRRMVHDLASELGKRIELVTVGEETELDKTVIERLNDPLIHLIRNAIDHGLEDPEGRAAVGKPVQGRITLSAMHSGAEVLVSIADDGRGLDRTRIQARAEENGLISAGGKLSDAELFQVIFQPGFSTAREVTNLSGRGVGMDVVKRTIDALRGKIDVSSTFGAGSKITLRLPLTLAIIDGLLVRVGAGRYVIPLSAVEECVELSTEEDARSRGRSFLNIRGDLVPFIRLRELFNASAAADRYQKVVIVSAGDLRVGLVVDQVIGDHQTVIKSLSKLHANVEIFSGATILGDGEVSLILDVGHLVETGQQFEANLKAAS